MNRIDLLIYSRLDSHIDYPYFVLSLSFDVGRPTITRDPIFRTNAALHSATKRTCINLTLQRTPFTQS